MTVQTIRYKSLTPGPNLLILGAVHGNEKCGTRAIQRLIQLLNEGTLSLARGQLSLIPICNPKAFAQDVRFVERNLNRHVYPKSEPKAYEDYLDGLICPELAVADYLLDLHSFASQGGPFVFLSGTDDEETAFARTLGVRFFIHGWKEAFQTVSSRPDTEAQRLEAMGTTSYARAENGAKAITLECGHHYNTDAARIGLVAAIRAMLWLDMLDPAALPETLEGFPPEDADPILKQVLTTDHAAISIEGDTKYNNEHGLQPTGAAQVCVKMHKVFYKEKPGELTRPWQHLDAVKKDDVLAQFEDGTHIVADEDSYVILPKLSAQVGGEWFYLGTPSDFPSAN
jgi:hypothetical protein